MAKNETGGYVHCHGYGQSTDPVTGNVRETAIGTVVVAPGEEFPEWYEPEEHLTTKPEDSKEPVVAGVGQFPFDLDRAEEVAQAQGLEMKKRQNAGSAERSTASDKPQVPKGR